MSKLSLCPSNGVFLQNSSVGVSPSFAASNPFVPSTSFRPPLDSPSFCKRSPQGKGTRAPTSASQLDSPRAADDDSDSVDSLILDDGPNPVRVVTPGAAATTRAFAPAADFQPDSPSSACHAGGNANSPRAAIKNAAQPGSDASEVGYHLGCTPVVCHVHGAAADTRRAHACRSMRTRLGRLRRQRRCRPLAQGHRAQPMALAHAHRSATATCWRC
jgi:hypothetical protein